MGIKYKIEFEQLVAEITEDQYRNESFDVDFQGQMMVRFNRTSGKVIAINGMNGGGINIASEISGKEPIITRIN